MKTIDLFCASPASTAICSRMNQRSMVRRGATRPIDDHHHSQIHGDRRKNRIPIPCSSQLIPIDPKPYNYQKSRKSTSSNQSELRRKSSADVTDMGSSRYLLSETPFYDLITDNSDHVTALVPTSQPLRPRAYVSSSDDHSLSLKSSSTRDQVVELRVSIHCKGCEGKVRKHISRMEGVRSFDIDLSTKKVTVVGDVTPLGVLTSVSRVKYAQFWPSPTSSSSPSSSSSSSSSSTIVDLKY